MPRDHQNEAKALWKSYKLRNKIGPSRLQFSMIVVAAILFAAVLLAGLYVVLK